MKKIIFLALSLALTLVAITSVLFVTFTKKVIPTDAEILERSQTLANQANLAGEDLKRFQDFTNLILDAKRTAREKGFDLDNPPSLKEAYEKDRDLFDHLAKVYAEFESTISQNEMSLQAKKSYPERYNDMLSLENCAGGLLMAKKKVAAVVGLYPSDKIQSLIQNTKTLIHEVSLFEKLDAFVSPALPANQAGCDNPDIVIQALDELLQPSPISLSQDLTKRNQMPNIKTPVVAMPSEQEILKKSQMLAGQANLTGDDLTWFQDYTKAILDEQKVKRKAKEIGLDLDVALSMDINKPLGMDEEYNKTLEFVNHNQEVLGKVNKLREAIYERCKQKYPEEYREKMSILYSSAVFALMAKDGVKKIIARHQPGEIQSLIENTKKMILTASLFQKLLIFVKPSTIIFSNLDTPEIIISALDELMSAAQE